MASDESYESGIPLFEQGDERELRTRIPELSMLEQRPKNTVVWRLHAVLHGRLSSTSGEPASLIMMEVRPLVDGIQHVQFEMLFESCEPDVPDPEVLEIMPSEGWRFDPGSTGDGPEIESQPEYRISGQKLRRGSQPGPCNAAIWQTNGDAVLRLLKPAVLLRRYGDAEFQATCRVAVVASRNRTGGTSFKQQMVGGTNTDDPLIFRPTLPSGDDWSISLENLQEFMKDIGKAGQTSASALMKMDEESQHCLVSLHPPEQQMYYASRLAEKLLPNTKTWILNEPKYKEWLGNDDPSHSILWIRGRPGLGKTMLATFLVQELRRLPIITEGKGVIAYYFFVPNTTNQGNGVTIVLRSLVHQVILQKPELMKQLLEVYTQPGAREGLFSNQALLWKVLEQITLDAQLDAAYFVLDGLERCDEELLNNLKALIPKASPADLKSSSSTPPRHKGKWIVAGRDELAIEAALSGCSSIDLNTSSASYFERSHFEQYVRTSIEQLNLESLAPSSLQELVMARANWSFAWADFALEVVKRNSGDDIFTLEKRLPMGLLPLFDQTLDDLLRASDASARTILRAVLAILSVSYSVIPLRALGVLSEYWEGRTSDLGEMRTQVSAACRPFVQIHNDDTIELSDTSLKAFLTSTGTQGKLHQAMLRDLHKSLSTRCLRFLGQAFEGKATATDILEYPSLYWMDHGRESSQTPQDLETLLNSSTSFFAKNSEARKRWFAVYWRHRYGVGEPQPTNVTMMHIAAESGYSQLASALLRHGRSVEVNAADGSDRTPLHWAVLFRHCDIARVLLEAGADIHLRACDKGSVLEIAVQAGQKAMVQLLLEKGVPFETGILDKAGSEIKQLLLEHVQLAVKLQPEDRPVENMFSGRVVNIGSSNAYYSKRITVDKILGSDDSLDDLMADGRPGNIPEGERKVRWIHLPQNNMEWIEILMAKILKTPAAVVNLLRSDLWSNRVRRVDKAIHARCLRPVCIDFSRDSADAARSNSNKVMLVMPYLHWGMDKERRLLKNTIHMVNNGKNSLPSTSLFYTEDDRHQRILEKYLNRLHPLHVRRTLDQFYYFNLDKEDEMEFRDSHQTLSAYFLPPEGDEREEKGSPLQQGEETDREKNFPILMVDQLWLWVLEDDTVVTSFPGRWDTDNQCDIHDMTDIVAAVERRLVTKEWPVAVSSGSTLAELIANECSGILFDLSKYRDKWLQVCEIYESAIGDVANNESNLFQKFCSAVKDKRDWNAKGGEKERYVIVEEVELLSKIKDIRDELNMIRTVFQTQRTLLKDPDLFKTLQKLVDGRIGDVNRIDHQACQAQEALRQTLDLKQKQANAEEAHFLSVQNIESGKQSQAIMTFTVVTIVFAPLSFLTSFLALQVVEFPTWTVGLVLEILLPVSAVVVIICVVLAFFNVLKEWWQKPRSNEAAITAEGEAEKGSK